MTAWSLKARILSDSLLSNLDPVSLARVIGAAQEVAYQAGETIFRQGSPADSVYLIQSGIVCLDLPSGRQVTALEGRFGEDAICDIPRYICTARALSDIVVIKCPLASFPNRNTLAREFKANTILSLGSSLAADNLAITDATPSKQPALASSTEIIGWFMCLLVPIFLYQQAIINLLPKQVAIFLALLSAGLIMWVFRLVDEFIPPLILILSALFIGLVPQEIALSGFSSSSFITLLGVFALSQAISSSGLSYRFVLWLLKKLPNRPIFQETALLAAGYSLSPISPSANNRLALVLPLFRDMRESLSLQKTNRSATALMAACFSGSMLMAAMFATSRSASISALEMISVQVRDQFSGIYWFAAAAVAALVLTLLHFVFTRWLFFDSTQNQLSKQRITEQLGVLGKINNREIVAIVCFFLFIIGSSTVSLHHINPAWLSGLVLIILLLTDSLSKDDFQKKIDWPMLVFLLGIDCLTRIMHHLGIHNLLSNYMSENFNFVHGSVEIFVVTALGITCALRLILPVTAGMLVACIMLIPLAELNGIHPWICVFLSALFSDIWFFPYQCSSYMQIRSAGLHHEFNESSFLIYNRLIDMGRVAAAFVSLPYWRWLGLL